MFLRSKFYIINTRDIIYKYGIETKRISSKEQECVLADLKANTLYGIKVVAVSYDDQVSRPVSINCRTSK